MWLLWGVFIVGMGFGFLSGALWAAMFTHKHTGMSPHELRDLFQRKDDL